jgi:thioredoxin-like negative regulator of GroEL
MDFLGALFDWREGRGAAAEATLLDLSGRAESNNRRTVVKNLSSLYLQVGDFKQAQDILSGVEEDADVKKLKSFAALGLGSASADSSKGEE